MFGKLLQLGLSVAVVGIALAVGFVAVQLLGPSPFDAASSDAAGATDGRPSPSDGSSPSRSPDPTPDPADVAVLVGAGDIAECDGSQDELTAEYVAGIPGIVFTVGDNANPGTRENFTNCYAPTWGRPDIKERTRPAAGDADYEVANAAPYYDYFGEAAGTIGAGYYAYDAGTWRVYVLNSNCGNVGGCREGSAQATWLARDLRANPRECVLAMWHHAHFSSGQSGGGGPERRDLWRILEDAGAELILGGHDHHYERFAPQTVEGRAAPDGIVQFILGTGGSRPGAVGEPAPNSEVLAAGVFGALRLELLPGRYAFDFVAVAGPEFSDSGSGRCH